MKITLILALSVLFIGGCSSRSGFEEVRIGIVYANNKLLVIRDGEIDEVLTTQQIDKIAIEKLGEHNVGMSITYKMSPNQNGSVFCEF
jgi:hypothetical protein